MDAARDGTSHVVHTGLGKGLVSECCHTEAWRRIFRSEAGLSPLAKETQGRIPTLAALNLGRQVVLRGCALRPCHDRHDGHDRRRVVGRP